MLSTLLTGSILLLVTAMLCASALRAWHGWLALKRLELDQARPAARDESDVGLRIELAGVKERLKKLEAIASGVEL